MTQHRTQSTHLQIRVGHLVLAVQTCGTYALFLSLALGRSCLRMLFQYFTWQRNANSAFLVNFLKSVRILGECFHIHTLKI